MKQGHREKKNFPSNQDTANAPDTKKDTAAALEKELRKFKVLYNLAVAMTGDNSLDENLDLVVEQSRLLLNADTAFLALAEKRSGRIRMHTLSGITSPEFKRLEVTIGRGMGGRVLQTLNGIIVNDYLADPNIIHEYDHVVKAEGLRSGLAVPLQVGARNLGVLYVFNRYITDFSSNDLDTLFLIGNLASVEVARRWAEADLQKTRLELERRVDRRTRELTKTNKRLCDEIEERNRAEAALRQNERRNRELYEKSRKAEDLYRSLLNSSADAIIIYDMNGQVNYVSPAFTQMFGWTLDQLEGKRIPFVPESEQKASMAIIIDLIENGTPCQGFETRRLTKDGRMLDVSISGSRYHDHKGRPAGMLSIIRDMSETKRLEARFHQAQRMEAIGTLAGGIAHDFNNLLMAIQGRTSLLMSDIPPDSSILRHLKGIDDHIATAAALTRQLLGFARGGKYKVELLDLNRLVSKNAELFIRTRKQVKVRSLLKSDLWRVEADESQMEQVLLNVMLNAVQAMPEGGVLCLETDNVNLENGGLHPHSPKPGRYVKISVSDTGVGIAPDIRDRIFEPFFTTKAMGRGTGLGLASAYGIVKNHGGYIDVDTHRDKGTVFHVFLPAADAGAPPAPGASASTIKGSGTIMLVEDEISVLEVTRDMLTRLGYQVMTAETGEQAVALFEQNKDRIDLVVLDMVIPGMNPGETFDLLRRMKPEMPIVISSGYSMENGASSDLFKKCSGFLQKPFDMKSLSKKIAEVMGSIPPA